MTPDLISSAAFSACKRYRYMLTRQWDLELPELAFVMLNPSTADDTTDDATIRRCRGFARRFGFGALHVVNLFAYRATQPRDLWAARREGIDIVGPDNALFQKRAFTRCHLAICAWGRVTAGMDCEVTRVRNLAWRNNAGLRSLQLTNGGDPAHPLRLPNACELDTWPSIRDVFGRCGSCQHPLYGPIATRHIGHCGSCDALVFGNPSACHLCGASFEPQDHKR